MVGVVQMLTTNICKQRVDNQQRRETFSGVHIQSQMVRAHGRGIYKHSRFPCILWACPTMFLLLYVLCLVSTVLCLVSTILCLVSSTLGYVLRSRMIYTKDRLQLIATGLSSVLNNLDNEATDNRKRTKLGQPQPKVRSFPVQLCWVAGFFLVLWTGPVNTTGNTPFLESRGSALWIGFVDRLAPHPAIP